MLCYSSQDNKPTKSQRAPDCGIPMLDGAGVVSVGARNTDPEGYEAPGKWPGFSQCSVLLFLPYVWAPGINLGLNGPKF